MNFVNKTFMKVIDCSFRCQGSNVASVHVKNPSGSQVSKISVVFAAFQNNSFCLIGANSDGGIFTCSLKD